MDTTVHHRVVIGRRSAGISEGRAFRRPDEMKFLEFVFASYGRLARVIAGAALVVAGLVIGGAGLVASAGAVTCVR